MNVKIKILDDRLGSDFPMPNYMREGDAGIDLRAMIDEPVFLSQNNKVTIKSGIALQMPKNMCALIVPRSGLGVKGLNIANTIGVIDSNYTGELLINLTYNPIAYHQNNDKHRMYSPDVYIADDNIFKIDIGDRIAQLLFVPIVVPNLNFVASLDVSNRGDNGFNSTGVK